MTRDQIEIAGAALIVAIFGVAQRLGNWESKPLAKVIGIVAGCFSLVLCFLFFPIWAALPVGAIIWTICLWAIFQGFRKPADQAATALQADAPPAQFNPAEHPDEEFPVVRKLATFDEAPGLGYPLKVYVEMLNNTGACAEISASRWLSGIKAELLPGIFQLWLGYGWFPRPDGIAKIHVPPGERFRLWVAPDKDKYERQVLQQLCDAKNFGTVMIRVNAKECGIIL